MGGTVTDTRVCRARDTCRRPAAARLLVVINFYGIGTSRQSRLAQARQGSRKVVHVRWLGSDKPVDACFPLKVIPARSRSASSHRCPTVPAQLCNQSIAQHSTPAPDQAASNAPSAVTLQCSRMTRTMAEFLAPSFMAHAKPQHPRQLAPWSSPISARVAPQCGQRTRGPARTGHKCRRRIGSARRCSSGPGQ